VIVSFVFWSVAELMIITRKKWSESPRENISGKTI